MSKPCAIQKQIESSNEIIADLRERIRKMERRLQDPQMPEERCKEVETELTEIKKMLETNEEMLQKLHRENSKSFAVAACLFFACFLIYGVYVLIVGT